MDHIRQMYAVVEALTVAQQDIIKWEESSMEKRLSRAKYSEYCKAYVTTYGKKMRALANQIVKDYTTYYNTLPENIKELIRIPSGFTASQLNEAVGLDVLDLNLNWAKDKSPEFRKKVEDKCRFNDFVHKYQSAAKKIHPKCYIAITSPEAYREKGKPDDRFYSLTIRMEGVWVADELLKGGSDESAKYVEMAKLAQKMADDYRKMMSGLPDNMKSIVSYYKIDPEKRRNDILEVDIYAFVEDFEYTNDAEYEKNINQCYEKFQIKTFAKKYEAAAKKIDPNCEVGFYGDEQYVLYIGIYD